MDLGLTGLRALVTGGTKGIGRACAEILAAEGADVAICARNAEEVEQTCRALEATGAKAHGGAVDVADKAALDAWVKGSAEALGGIDLVVANVSALASAMSEDAWRQGLEIDILHTTRTVEAAMPWLEQSKAASITIIASVSGRETSSASAYGAVKAALIHYAKGLAVELAPKGIRVNAVSPGTTYFEGGVWHKAELNAPERYKAALARNPTGRMGRPEEIARGVVFLASPASSFTTGSNLVIDGALTRGVQY
ncbi:SDR family NAD(P)-dependent oxidoreductase [Geminicoccaceae bacterium 1502E]|nr:SDR family NAD(P)-dependent oxidoreductase [Geminicoccaceae bacterium 1502E]